MSIIAGIIGSTVSTASAPPEPNTFLEVQQWLGDYSGGGANGDFYVRLADYPAAASIPVGAEALISDNGTPAQVIVESNVLATEYGESVRRIAFANFDGAIYSATTGSFGWYQEQDVTGTITVGYNDTFGDRYGYQNSFPGPYGSASTTPSSIIQSLYVTSQFTALRLTGGTYGSVTVDGMSGEAAGHSSIIVNVDGVSTTVSLGGPSAGGYSIAGDPLGLAGKNGQTLAISMVLA
jgi:hypothetical protein